MSAPGLMYRISDESRWTVVSSGAGLTVRLLELLISNSSANRTCVN